MTKGYPWTEEGTTVVPETGQMSTVEKDGGSQSLGEVMTMVVPRATGVQSRQRWQGCRHWWKRRFPLTWL